MPTPSGDGLASESVASVPIDSPSSRPACPEEPRRRPESLERPAATGSGATVDSSTSSLSEAAESSTRNRQSEDTIRRTPSPRTPLIEKRLSIEDGPVVDVLSPTSSVDDSAEPESRSPPYYSGNGDDTEESFFPPLSRRFLANTSSSLLRPGSKFHGEQKSDSARYGVQVQVQHVDMAESFLCGYLSIQGLTNSEHTLTTYFEGEIIGTKYTFQTKHADWGASERVDMQHWARFPAWRPLSRSAKKPHFSYKDFAQRENIFMRWKEYFLVPDHNRKTINGASYEGFYYICFNQVSGTISGMYYHARTAGYQKLELQHVNDHGCLGATEFR